MAVPAYTWSAAWTPALIASLERFGCRVKTSDTDTAGHVLPNEVHELIVTFGAQNVVFVVYKSPPHWRLVSEHFGCLHATLRGLELADLVETLLLALGARPARGPISLSHLYKVEMPDWEIVRAELARFRLSLTWTESTISGLHVGRVKCRPPRLWCRALRLRAGRMTDPVCSSERWFIALGSRMFPELRGFRRPSRLIVEVDVAFHGLGFERVNTSALRPATV